MKKVSFEDMLFMEKKSKGFCLSFYASNFMEFDRLIDEAKLIARKDFESGEYCSFFESLDIYKKYIDSFPSAIFISSELHYYVPLLTCKEELVVVSTSFHVKPLIKMYQRSRNLALLQFSEDQVQLFQINMKNITLIDIFELPKNSTDYLDIDRFVRQHLSEKKPLLIISGQEKYVKNLRDSSLYGNIFPTTFHSHLYKNGASLINHIYRHIDSYFFELESRSTSRITTAKQKGRLATDVDSIFSHALAGEIKTLFVAENEKLWGSMDFINKKISIHSQQMNSYDDDILDDLAELVLKFKGNVVVLPSMQLPNESLVCAILRDDFEKIIHNKKAI